MTIPETRNPTDDSKSLGRYRLRGLLGQGGMGRLFVAEQQGNTLVENARLFAMLNVALADAAVVSWDCKYEFNLWRPVTAIHEASERRPLPALDRLHVVRWEEGPAAQILHIGPYSEETPTIRRLHAAIVEAGHDDTRIVMGGLNDNYRALDNETARAVAADENARPVPGVRARRSVERPQTTLSVNAAPVNPSWVWSLAMVIVNPSSQ